MEKYKIFIASDVHGKWIELWQAILDTGFDPANNFHILILNGDLIDYNVSPDINEPILTDVFKKIDKYNNIIFLKGNHEVNYANQSSAHCQRLKTLPMIYSNDNLFVCHGWFNPYWEIDSHQTRYNYKHSVNDFGTILDGSPACIFNRMRLGINYFQYSDFQSYEAALISHFPKHTFVFGHYFNFLWSYKKTLGMSYLEVRGELNKLMNHESNMITEMAENFDYSQPFISEHKKIYCTDVFTKAHMFNLKYYFCVLTFTSNTKGEVWYKNNRVKEIFNLNSKN